VAALQKTWSGDLTQEIAGRIWDAIKNYDEEQKLKEASPKVKQAARELRKEDPDVPNVQSMSTAIVVKDAILPVHIKVEDTNKEVRRLSGKVTAQLTGIADTTKLIGDQNAMIEAKLDTMLALLRARGAGEEEIKDGVTGGGGTSGTGAIVPVSKNLGDGLGGFLGKKYAAQILRRASKFLRRRILPRRLRAGARLLRMKGKKFLRPITRQLSRVRPKNLMRAGAQRFIRSGIGKKLTKKLGTKALTKIGGKAVGKAAAKKIPIAGAVFGSIFAIQRAMQGDWAGAGLELASGVASIFPGVGTGISVALDAGLMARDIHKEVKSNTPVVPEREMGSGTDVMGMFKQASSLLLSSMMPIAASAGTLPEVKNQIKSAGLDDVEIARMQPPTGLTIGRGGKKVSLGSVEPTQEKIPKLPPLPGLDKPKGDDRNILQKGFDWTKDKLGGAWNWTKKKAGQAWNWVKEGTKANVEKVKAFVSNTAESINNSEIANNVRNVIGSEKDDGFIGPKWMGIKNPFAKGEDNNVKSETVAVPNGTKSETSGGDYDQFSGARAIMDIDSNITEKGAAYLAGNIQQESGWDGMRSWGQVLGDGTSRNGGLVSWASWEGDSARLGKIEDHYGKKIDEITEREQLVWMLKEMKQDYPSAYSVFTNPKATVEDLKKASMSYWGYGHEGSRFSYAEKIHQEMLRQQFNQQKEGAEKGAILPSTEVSIKSHHIQDSSTVVDEIEDAEPPQPIVYLTNSEISTNPLVIVKKSSNSKDFVEQYRFMSLGAA
tara:strand:+ start:678 stop:2993 length:2316 start_codon:yes stop_codon:yes gene_type:complete